MKTIVFQFQKQAIVLSEEAQNEINEPRELLGLRVQNDFELYVEEVRKRRNQKKYKTMNIN